MADARAGAEIGNDALREVFARLPGLRDLLRCAATCKRWRRLVTDRDFLRRVGLWPDTARRPCVLAGIFSQTTLSANGSRTKTTPYAPPLFLGLQAGLDVRDRRLPFDSFVTVGDDHRLFHLARPLASRHGFLLTRLLLPSSSPGDGYSGQRNLLAVCRPLVDRRSTYLLPPPPFDMTQSHLDYSIKGCAIVTPADHAVGDGNNLADHKHHQQLPMFQVLLIYYQDEFVCACTYSSDMPGDWSAPVKCCRVSGLTKYGPRAGVVTHGFVHWLFEDDNTNLMYTLNINVATSDASLTKTPIRIGGTLSQPPIPCIAGPEERLSFVTIQDHGLADLWTRLGQDEGGHDGDWQCSELIKLGDVGIDMVFFAEKRGALLIEQGGVFSILDLKSKEMMPMNLKDERTERLKGTRRFPASSCSSTCCCCRHFGSKCLYRVPGPVLYEMDWAFMSFVSSQVGDNIRMD